MDEKQISNKSILYDEMWQQYAKSFEDYFSIVRDFKKSIDLV